MPYITQDRRKILDEAFHLNDLETVQVIKSPGELNYLITRIVMMYLRWGRSNYTGINDVMGVFECAKAEFYRRIAAPYENDKFAENGEVYAGVKHAANITQLAARLLSDQS